MADELSFEVVYATAESSPPVYETKSITTTTKTRKAIILWDIENIKVPDGKIVPFVKALELEYGINRMIALGDFGVKDKYTIQLHSAGVELHYIPRMHSGQRETSDRAIGRKMAEVEEPSTLVLISNDGDFAHDVTQAHKKGHHVHVVHGPKPSHLLKFGLADKKLFIDTFLPRWSKKICFPSANTSPTIHRCEICDKIFVRQLQLVTHYQETHLRSVTKQEVPRDHCVKTARGGLVSLTPLPCRYLVANLSLTCYQFFPRCNKLFTKFELSSRSCPSGGRDKQKNKNTFEYVFPTHHGSCGLEIVRL